MHGSQQRFALCLAAALLAHAALFAWSSSNDASRTAAPLRVTRTTSATAPIDRDATHAVHDQRGQADRSLRARIRAARVGARDKTNPGAPTPITRFVVVAEPATPIPSASEDQRERSDANRQPAQTEQVRNASRDARAAYLAAWQAHIEARGSRNYPTDLLAGGGTRRLTMGVRLASDGSLIGVRILRSSGSRALDAAAIGIVRDAAPFAAFDPAMAADNGELGFAYEWLFETGTDTHLQSVKPRG